MTGHYLCMEYMLGCPELHFMSVQWWNKKLRLVIERHLDSTAIMLFWGTESHFWQQLRTLWFDFRNSCTKQLAFALAFSWYYICWLMWHPFGVVPWMGDLLLDVKHNVSSWMSALVIAWKRGLGQGHTAPIIWLRVILTDRCVSSLCSLLPAWGTNTRSKVCNCNCESWTDTIIGGLYVSGHGNTSVAGDGINIATVVP